MEQKAYLKVNSINVVYPGRNHTREPRQVLFNVSFALHAGTVLAVIGPNGAGKSTLIRALSGIIPLQSGNISIMGRDLAKMTPGDLAHLMAVVPQARMLPPAFTAWETVLLGRTPYLNWLGHSSYQDEEIAHQAMERTHTLELSERRVGELSGGEQQRLLLARALAQTTSILLLDEPTTHLDIQHQIDLLKQVSVLAHRDHLAVLIVMHDLNLVARYADKVALFVEGYLAALGEPGDVLTAECLSQAYQIPLQVISPDQQGHRFIVPA